MSEPTTFDELVMRVHDHGPQVLTDRELVALILRTGRASGLEPADGVLRECGGLPGLPTAEPVHFLGNGIGPVRSASLLAAIEMGRRLARQEVPPRRPLSRPCAVASYIALRYSQRDQEIMGALYLDVRHRLIGERELYRGTLSRAAVEPREVLKTALLRGAASVILFHTHPSGDPSPSLEDLAFTRRLRTAGDAVGVKLSDHLVIGNTGRWVSLKDRGAL